MSQQNTDLGPQTVELNEMGVLSLTLIETLTISLQSKTLLHIPPFFSYLIEI